MDVLSSLLFGRDISYFFSSSDVVACSVDFSQAIGPEAEDSIHSSIITNCYFVARAALVELLTLNIVPKCLTIGVSKYGSKTECMEAVHYLQKELGREIAVSFSHENYVSVSESTMCCSAFGIQAYHLISIRPFTGRAHCYVLRIETSSGSYIVGSRDHLSLRQIELISRDGDTLYFIPMGSRGCLEDFKTYTQVMNLTLTPTFPDYEESMTRSGGPGLSFLLISKSPVAPDKFVEVGMLCSQ